jgi:hypothetical protein
MNKDLLTAEELKSKLLAVGAEKYHHKHPFHLLMHEGKLTRGQLQAWALNRYYYQSRIPIKDAIILSKSEDPKFRRESPITTASPATRPVKMAASKSGSSSAKQPGLRAERSSPASTFSPVFGTPSMLTFSSLVKSRCWRRSRLL